MLPFLLVGDINDLSVTVALSEMEFDLDKALEDVPIHIEDPPSAPKVERKASVGLCELPSEEATKLQHFTKLRPKRNKRTHPKKIPVSTSPSRIQ